MLTLQSLLAGFVCPVGNVGGNLHYSDCIIYTSQARWFEKKLGIYHMASCCAIQTQSSASPNLLFKEPVCFLPRLSFQTFFSECSLVILAELSEQMFNKFSIWNSELILRGFQFAWKLMRISKWISETEPNVVLTRFLSDTFSLLTKE